MFCCHLIFYSILSTTVCTIPHITIKYQNCVIIEILIYYSQLRFKDKTEELPKMKCVPVNLMKTIGYQECSKLPMSEKGISFIGSYTVVSVLTSILHGININCLITRVSKYRLFILNYKLAYY